MATTACFVIVGRNDSPIYESEVGSGPRVRYNTQLLGNLDGVQSRLLPFMACREAEGCAVAVLKKETSVAGVR